MSRGARRAGHGGALGRTHGGPHYDGPAAPAPGTGAESRAGEGSRRADGKQPKEATDRKRKRPCAPPEASQAAAAPAAPPIFATSLPARARRRPSHFRPPPQRPGNALRCPPAHPSPPPRQPRSREASLPSASAGTHVGARKSLPPLRGHAPRPAEERPRRQGVPPWVSQGHQGACTRGQRPGTTGPPGATTWPGAKERLGVTHTTEQLHKVKYNKMFNEQIRLSKYETATESRRGTGARGLGAGPWRLKRREPTT